MTGQSKDAAERSAHVLRDNALVDTRAEAVERLAERLLDNQFLSREAVAAMLRRLLAERDAATALRDELQGLLVTHEICADKLKAERDAARAALAEAVREDAPVTRSDLANAFGCMWNAAIGVSHERQEGIAVASMLAEGFQAMATSLRARGEGDNT